MEGCSYRLRLRADGEFSGYRIDRIPNSPFRRWLAGLDCPRMAEVAGIPLVEVVECLRAGYGLGADGDNMQHAAKVATQFGCSYYVLAAWREGRDPGYLLRRS